MHSSNLFCSPIVFFFCSSKSFRFNMIKCSILKKQIEFDGKGGRKKMLRTKITGNDHDSDILHRWAFYYDINKIERKEINQLTMMTSKNQFFLSLFTVLFHILLYTYVSTCFLISRPNNIYTLYGFHRSFHFYFHSVLLTMTYLAFA